jgi:hypothetical protein
MYNDIKVKYCKLCGAEVMDKELCNICEIKHSDCKNCGKPYMAEWYGQVFCKDECQTDYEQADHYNEEEAEDKRHFGDD